MCTSLEHRSILPSMLVFLVPCCSIVLAAQKKRVRLRAMCGRPTSKTQQQTCGYKVKRYRVNGEDLFCSQVAARINLLYRDWPAAVSIDRGPDSITHKGGGTRRFITSYHHHACMLPPGNEWTKHREDET